MPLHDIYCDKTILQIDVVRWHLSELICVLWRIVVKEYAVMQIELALPSFNPVLYTAKSSWHRKELSIDIVSDPFITELLKLKLFLIVKNNDSLVFSPLFKLLIVEAFDPVSFLVTFLYTDFNEFAYW